jgi:cysteinyl-tRNA synthetase
MSNNTLQLYNTLTRKKEVFTPIAPPFVGLYVCGPTVYGNSHLGHARPYVTFDIVTRYLRYIGYTVRYVRNITDVGHLENDADEGEDKIAKKARLEKLEPMEVVQHYSLGFHRNMAQLNNLPPSIEPQASGHIIEQIEMIKKIMEHGYAYESHGSVYFDINRYEKDHRYGQLSGRVTEDLLHTTRELDGQSEKHSPIDFALWKKAMPEHIMRWPSPWSDGFPGWHIECSAMSKKYLGETFDIHGGGMDLLFPHHECEIAQSVGSSGKQPVKYWMHNNMLTINGQKMGKSLNNFINLDELFTGSHKLLEKAYSPMTLRFCLLQSHYRNPIDFSNKGLQDAEKGLAKLSETYLLLRDMKWVNTPVNADVEKELSSFETECNKAMDDDFNTAIVISHMFQCSAHVNRFHASGKTEGVSEKTFENFKKVFALYFTDILGLIAEEKDTSNEDFDNLVNTLIEARTEAKQKKDFTLSDTIRNILSKFVVLQDSATTTVWKHERKK